MADREWPNSPVNTGLVMGVREIGCRAALVKGISRRGGPGMVSWEGTEMISLHSLLYLIVENK